MRRIQPDDGISLQLGVKPPGLTADFSKVAMRFSCEAAFGKSSANGYERLLLDAMLGDATLFSHRDGVEGELAQPFPSTPPRPSGRWLPWRMARIAYPHPWPIY